MTLTRTKARADLAGLFDQGIERELEEATNNWWSEEAQTVLRALAAKLKKKS